MVNVLSKYLEEVFNLKTTDIGLLTTIYLIGAVLGALIFGFLSDILGRKKLFSITLIIYIISIICITFSFSKYQFLICRFFTGVAVGGEYSAIFSAIDELLPAYIRGRADLIIDGTWHLGSAIASILSYITTNYISSDNNYLSIRILFFLGVIFAIIVLYLRTKVPESPRWLAYKGKVIEAINTVKDIDKECSVKKRIINNNKNTSFSTSYSKNINDYNDYNSEEQLMTQEEYSSVTEDEFNDDYSDRNIKNNLLNKTLDNTTYISNKEKSLNNSKIKASVSNNQKSNYTYILNNLKKQAQINSHLFVCNRTELKSIFKLFFIVHIRRFLYGFTLMSTQSLFYLGIFYSYNQVLVNIENIPKQTASLYQIPLSIASFLGPLLLGKYFDTYSRRKMICLTNLITFALTFVIAFNFKYRLFNFLIEQILFFITFIFASPAASSAHLTISEIFPLEVRSQALSIFFFIGYGVSSISPYYFSYLIDSNDKDMIFIAYLTVSIAMGTAGIVSFYLGLDTENKSLEEINS